MKDNIYNNIMFANEYIRKPFIPNPVGGTVKVIKFKFFYQVLLISNKISFIVAIFII